ncbi:hypothetical protein FQZ97_967550 [compost metagenome]
MAEQAGEHHQQGQRQPVAAQVAAGKPPEVLGQGEDRLVGAGRDGFELNGLGRQAAYLPGGRVPPVQLDGRQPVMTGAFHHIVGPVHPAPAQGAALAVVQRLQARGAQVALQAVHFGQFRRRDTHRQGTVDGDFQLAGEAVADPQGFVGADDALAQADVPGHQRPRACGAGGQWLGTEGERLAVDGQRPFGFAGGDLDG